MGWAKTAATPMVGVWEEELGDDVGVQGLAPVAGQPFPEALPFRPPSKHC